jgi:hypothetical protein
METEKILMGQRQLQRWDIMKMVEVRPGKDGGKREGVSATRLDEPFEAYWVRPPPCSPWRAK